VEQEILLLHLQHKVQLVVLHPHQMVVLLIILQEVVEQLK